jgi:2-dehydropantoate 2-reductase
MSGQPDLEWPRVAVVGAGAVGCYFGGILARAGAPVTLIGRPGPRSASVEAITRDGLWMDTLQFQERVQIAVSADAAAVRDAEFVLFAVKTTDNETAARGIAPHLRAGAVVISLQNGVENEAALRAAFAAAPGATKPSVLPAVVYVAASMPAPGRLKHVGRGDLVIGPGRDTESAAQVQRVAEFFVRAGVPCRISPNIEGELWTKLVWNCAGNAVSALGRASYGLAGGLEPTRHVMAAAAEEVVAVARAAGVTLPEVNLVETGPKLAAAMGVATSSTSQDVERGRKTEIDSLNGFIARRGAELGVPTPVNHTLWALVKLLEERNAQTRGRAAGGEAR